MSAVTRILDIAMQHHQAGRLNRAKSAYRKLIRQIPNHPDGLHGLGLIAHQQGNHKRAAELISNAIEVSPELPLFYINLGIVLVAGEDLNRAEETLHNAVAKFGRTYRYKTEMAEIHGQLGDLYIEKCQLDSAFKHFSHVQQLQADNAQSYRGMGHIQIKRGNLDSGINYLKYAIRIQPGLSAAYDLLGRVFHDSGDLDKARSYYELAIQVQPDLPTSYFNMGNLLLEAGIVDPAIGYLRKALQINPDYAEAHVNLGIAKLDQRDFEGSLNLFKHACQLKQDDLDLHWYWSHALLLRGYFAEGWAENEWRLKLGRRIITTISAPFWDGSLLVGRIVAILAEQGVGDQIMFLSCLQDFLDKAHPDKCIFECESRLIQLYRRSFPTVHFLAKQQDGYWPANYPQTDVKIAIGSLPRVLRTRSEDFPRRAGYLVPDTERIMQWKARYQSLGADMVIGISWRGGHSEQARRQRSTSLAQWMPVLSTQGTAFINLQYGDCKQELESLAVAEEFVIHDWPDADPLNDLDGLAAQIAALDLVISIDNCTVHMAGAVGVPVWTLLPFVPNWRWMRYREDTPWYPTMKLFRQPKPGDWGAVFEDIAKQLSRSARARQAHSTFI